ncbi:MAG: hypothetical protein OHK0045_15330 [Raineya sp.]
MKIKKLSKFILLGLLSGNTLFAQEQTQVQVLEGQAKEMTLKFAKQQQEVQNYARTHQVPLKGFNEKGQFFWLHHISEAGKPVYYVTRNSGAASSMRVNRLWTGGGLGLELNGQNMEVSSSRARMGVWEPGVVRTTHQEFGNRATIRDGSTFSGPSGDNQHATHVAGTMIAAGVNASAKGMAWQARLDVYDASDDVAEMTTAASQGMLISNHSYGPLFPEPSDYWTRGYYDSEAQAWDNLCFNAPFYLPVQACGNDRDEGSGLTYDLLLGSSNAKNTLGIGAVQKLSGPYSSPSSVVMSDFSSYGPTDDGRIKPDLVAPGVQIFSANDTDNDQYTNLDGTSMAGPAAAGALFLLQQHYKNLNNNNFMRAATLRGLAIHTAEEAGANPGPDYGFGWGLINVERAVGVISNTGNNHILSEQTLNNGANFTRQVTVPGGQPFKVTICWTDRPATPLPANSGSENNRTSRLVNDLDLRLKNASGADVELPWKLNPNTPNAAATRGDNTVDNVEQIAVANLPAGTYTITVTHKGTLQGGSQAFSLIASGGASNNSGGGEPTALAEIVELGISVYPNPTKGKLHIQANMNENTSVMLRNALGQIVAQEKLQNHNSHFNTEKLPEGLYFVEFEGVKSRIKVVIQK